MYLKLKPLLIATLILLLFLPLFAQVPDPFDPDFSPKYDIITAETAKKHQVKRLIIYKNGDLFNTIIFNSEGEILRHGNETFFTLYDEKGWKKERYNFVGGSLVGKTSYTMTPYGDDKVKNREYQSSLISVKEKTSYTYAKGLLSEIAVSTIRDMAYSVEYEDIYYNYTYDSKRKLKKMRVKTNISAYGLYNSSSSKIDSMEYENGRLIFFTDDTITFKCYYDSAGRLDHINEVNPDTNSWIKEITIDRYTYNDIGLIKSHEEGAFKADMWTYEYDFFEPATFMVEIPDQYKEILTWNYAQSSNRQTHVIKNSHTIAKINVPGMELYVAQLTPQLAIPLIVQPGAKIHLTATNSGISYAKEDTMNTFAFDLEQAKHQAYTLYGEDNAPAAMANHIVIELKNHADHPAFLYYTDFWDLGNHKQLFLDYTQKLLKLYPNNYKVKEVYALLRKSN